MAIKNIIPDHDSHSYQYTPADPWGDNDVFYVRKDVTTSKSTKVFIKWSPSLISSSLPRNAKINSATLYIYVSTAASGFAALWTKLCDADWDESTLTWNNMPSISGGEIGSTMNLTTTGWKSNIITTIFNNWFTGAANNYGIMFWTDEAESGSAGAGYVNTSENVSYQPYVLVNYTVPGGFFIFLSEAWQRHKKLWTPKGLILPKEGYSYLEV
ncbi:hypothetical protein ES707_11743 [subsurface metagenome]